MTLRLLFNYAFGWLCVAAIFYAATPRSMPPWSKSLPTGLKVRRVLWSLGSSAAAFVLDLLARHIQLSEGLPYWAGAAIFIMMVFGLGFVALILWFWSMQARR